MKSPLKYHGGKSYLAKRIIDLLPPRDENFTHFHEACFGGGSVTFALDPEGLSETANDVDEELVNFWRVLGREDAFAAFIRSIECTPFCEEWFHSSSEMRCVVTGMEFSELQRAVDFFIRNRQSRQGLGKDYATPTKRTRRGMNENVSAWLTAIEGLPEVHERLKRIEIRNMDVCEFIRLYDHPKAVFYIDPPYLHETRSSTGEYRFEMSEFDHMRLLALLSSGRFPYWQHFSTGGLYEEKLREIDRCFDFSFEGRFLLSGYRSQIYDFAAEYQYWNRTDIKIDNKASSKRVKETKTECVWRNYT